MTQTTTTARATTCPECGQPVTRYNGYVRETSASQYVPGRRYMMGRHTVERCASRAAMIARTRAEGRSAALRSRYTSIYVVPAVVAGEINPLDATALLVKAAERWS